MVKTIEKLSSEQWVRAWEAVVDSSHQVLHWQEQVGRVFPELRATVQYLYENRRQWNEMYLADIDTDTFKTPAEKGAERVGSIMLPGLTVLLSSCTCQCKGCACQLNLAK